MPQNFSYLLKEERQRSKRRNEHDPYGILIFRLLFFLFSHAHPENEEFVTFILVSSPLVMIGTAAS